MCIRGLEEQNIMVTIKDIAKLANVSRGTVDRALNNKAGIKAETRENIINIAKALNYEPNEIGKALVLRNKIKLGFILEPISNPFFGEILKGVNESAKELNKKGISTEVYVMNTYEEEEQIELIRKLKKSKVNGLALTAIDSENIRNELDECETNGIKVVTCNTDITHCQRTCFIGTDHEKSARVAAELLGKLVSERGEFLVVIGYRYILAHRQRLKGFEDKIREEYPSIHIRKVIEVEEDDKIALSKTLESLENIPDINGIYIAGNGILGVANAIKMKNKSQLIKVIAYDYASYTVDLVKEGVIDAVICQEPVKQGYFALRILYDLIISGKQPKNEFLATSIDIRLKENIDDIFDNKDFFTL